MQNINDEPIHKFKFNPKKGVLSKISQSMEKNNLLEPQIKSEYDLHDALLNGRLEIITDALAKNKDLINLPLDDGCTPFEKCLNLGYFSIADKIANLEGFDLDCPGHNPLRATITVGNLSLANKLLTKGANPNYYQQSIGSILQLALEAGFYDFASELINKGAEINFRDARGWTAIMYAAFRGELKTVTFLIDHGADPNIRNNDGWNSVVGAMACGHSQIVEILLEHNGIFGEKYAQAALMSSVNQGNLNIALELLSRGVNPNFSDSKNECLLIKAIKQNNKKLALALLNHGANPNVKSHNGETALCIAAKIGDLEIIKKAS